MLRTEKAAARMSEYYDPNDGWRPSRRNPRRRQSTLSVAIEALAGGLVIAMLAVLVQLLLG
jgi:hypothetical protein